MLPEIQSLLSSNFLSMKIIISLIVAAAAMIATSASAAGSCPSYSGEPCPGGPTRGYNVTTKQWEMVPQCFPWVWLSEYYKGNIFSMYENQNACRAQRAIDFPGF